MVIGHIQTNFGLATVITSTYQHGGATAIVMELQDGEPLCTLSVNIEGVKLPEGTFLAKTWSENAEIAKAALDSGLFEDTGKRVPTGFVEAQVWRFKEPVPMQAYDACMVQDACNPSGVLHSFINLWKMENWGPASPIAVMYASKLCDMSGTFGEPASLNLDWKGVLALAETVVEEMNGLDTYDKANLASFKNLCGQLSAWTHCCNHEVSNAVFRRVVALADWTGKEAQRENFTNRYCREMAVSG
jgi:hypothetical protein